MFALAVLFILMLIALASIPPAVVLARRARHQAILENLEQAVRLNLPLATMMKTSAHALGGRLGWRLFRIGDGLACGDSLTEALRRVAPGLGQRSLAMIESAERVGRLPGTLKRLVDRHRAGEPGRQSFLLGIGYLITIMTIVTLVLAFLSWIVMPKFEMIFSDFDAPMPELTVRLLDMQMSVATVVGAVALVGVVLAIAMFLGTIFDVGRRLESVWSLALVVVGWVPPFRGMMRTRSLADAFCLIGQSLRSGSPLAAAIAESTRLAIHPTDRRRLADWSLLVEQGREVNEAAREAGMPAMVCDLMGAAVATGNVTATTEFLESHYDAGYSRLRNLMQAVVLPLVVLVIGLVEATILFGLFLPIPALINDVCDKTMLGGVM